MPRGALSQDPDRSPRSDRERALAVLKRHGRDATSFQLLEPGYRYFFDDDAFVAYVDTGGAWVAGGGPVAPAGRTADVARRFVSAARAARKRPSFFAVSRAFCEEAGLPNVLVGEQPFWSPEHWRAVVDRTASLRYQLRRARGKGVEVRRVSAAEMCARGSRTRREIEQLIGAWLGARPLAPMGFLVELAPFDFPDERVYLVAEQHDKVIGFLGAVPVYARRGWLVEDLLRTRAAPNGTAEMLVDAAMRVADEAGSEVVTLGLAPLAGSVPRRLKLARALSKPLYDFRGLHAFKSKLRPEGWEPIHVAAPPGASPWVALADGLSAFARGSMVRFGLATLARGPLAVVWALTVLLVIWTPMLALAPSARWFPSPLVQHAWVGFDVALGVGLFALCRRYRPWLAVGLASVVSADALVTIAEALSYNVPRATSALDLVVAFVACGGPLIGAVALWGMVRRRRAVSLQSGARATSR